MHVFLIAGKAGSGKDEVAHYIKESLDNTVITSFSKYIKMVVAETTNWNFEEATKPRQLLQEVGDYMRAVNQDYLTERIYNELPIYEKLGIKNVIISDVRLVNEVEYFKNKKDIKLTTIRINSKTSKKKLSVAEKQHHTETELDNYPYFDYIIENHFDSSIKEDINKLLEGMK